jgi:formylmethanofuran dehydrogenase subunit E
MKMADNNDQTNIDSELIEMMKKAERFHGHSCPGLAVGVVASKIALENAKRADDEELVAIVENDACGVDAIQALTGCTYGKGNLIHKDYGKMVFTFYNRDSGSAIRLSMKPDAFARDPMAATKRKELAKKIRSGAASDSEREEHNRLREAHKIDILNQGEDLFNIKEIKIPAPEKARVFNDTICENCGEPMMSTRICEKDGKKLCIPCCKIDSLKDQDK